MASDNNDKDSEHTGEVKLVEPINTIKTALAAGAAANFRPNPSADTTEPLSENYQTLKSLVEQKYPQVDVDLLEVGPGSAERQEAVIEQLREAGVAEDEEILRQAQVVLDTAAELDPQVLIAAEVSEKTPHASE